MNIFKKMMKIYFADATSDSAYQASLVTRDRALQSRQDAIDVLQRLLAQMDDDPLVTKARTNLEKILENPEVITDEVFNNIMSKTSEVLDSNMDQQIADTLAVARNRGITGPALAMQLDRAKNARASAMASAYRDAIIERSKMGKSTLIEAINATQSFMTQFFQNKRLLTEDLANVLQTIVEEPFQNQGAPGGAQAGGVPGVSRGTPINIDYGTGRRLGEPTPAEAAAQAEAERLRIEMARQNDADNFAARVRDGDYMRNMSTPGGTVTQPEGAKTGASLGSAGTIDGMSVEEFLNQARGGISSPQAPVNVGSNINQTLQKTAQDSVNSMLSLSPLNPGMVAGTTASQQLQNATQGAQTATSGLVGLGADLASRLTTSGINKPNYIRTQPQTATINPTTQQADSRGGAEGSITVADQAPIYFGGGTQEAVRAKSLANQGYDVIGTSEGAGVRYSASPAGTKSTVPAGIDPEAFSKLSKSTQEGILSGDISSYRGHGIVYDKNRTNNTASAGLVGMGADLMKKLLGK